MNKHVVIIGNGISGITCARTIRQLSDHRLTVISAESDHFYSRTALMYVYMGHMKYEHTKPYEDWFWKKNKIELLKKSVERVDTVQRTLHFSDRSSMAYDTLVIAAGSKSNKFGWPGQDLQGVQGLYNLQDLELMEQNTRAVERAVIVGGGLIGVEMTEMLLSRGIPVTFLVRERHFWDIVLPEDEAKLIGRHMADHHIDLRLETELKEIVGDDRGRVSAVITNRGERMACQFVGLTVGVSPNIGFLKGSGIETNRGVLVNEYFETNVDNVYAVGDCAQFRQALPGRRPIEQVWYTGRMHGETLGHTICGKKRSYQPGLWFNSAKFFDIEYQTYGDVPNQLREGEASFYWEHAHGKMCLRIVYAQRDHTVKGFNVLGMRLRHQVCDQWIREKRTLDYVMDHLTEANFDPEFFTKYEGAIVEFYRRHQRQEGVTA